MKNSGLIIVFAGAAVFLLLILLPQNKSARQAKGLPWRIEVHENGSSQVFGLTLGTSTLREAQELFTEEGAVSIFMSVENKLSVEAYFDRVTLSGLRGKMVLTLESAEAATQKMFDRGLRIRKLESGARKISLHPDDTILLKQSPVQGITYIPAVNLDEKLILRRFGDPAERIPEGDGVSHWLYPHLGLDIALRAAGKEVLQYVAPKDFERILGPLRSATHTGNP